MIYSIDRSRFQTAVQCNPSLLDSTTCNFFRLKSQDKHIKTKVKFKN